MASSDHAGGDLGAKVAAIRTRLEQLKTSSDRTGEQNTKATLIEPILLALGWDIYNPDEVDREYRHQPSDDPVDYALKLDGRPVLFIGVKALRSQLDDDEAIRRLLGYCTAVGVEWCVFTNGDEYRIYKAHAPVDTAGKPFRCFRISDEKIEEDALAAPALLSRPSVTEGAMTKLWQDEQHESVGENVLRILQIMFDKQDQELLQLIRERLPAHMQGLLAVSEAMGRIRVTIGQVPSRSDNFTLMPSKTHNSTPTVSPIIENSEQEEYVYIAGFELRVNTEREAVLPGCGLYDKRFQVLAEYALEHGELPDYWHRDRNGHLTPDRSRYSYHDSFSRSAYRHLERALYRIAKADGLL